MSACSRLARLGAKSPRTRSRPSTDIAKDAPKRADRLYAEAEDSGAGNGSRSSELRAGRFVPSRLEPRHGSGPPVLWVDASRQEAFLARDRDRHSRQSARCVARLHRRPSRHDAAPKWQPDTAQGGDGKPQPFSLAEQLANNTIARSKSAEALLKSIDALKAKLTPEQLDKVAEIEARFRAHHSGHGPHFDAPSPDDHGQAPTTAQRMGPIREIASESGTASNTLTCPAWGAAEKSAALLV